MGGSTLPIIGDVLGIAGNAYGAAKSASEAAKQQRQIADQDLAFQREIADRQYALAEPFLQEARYGLPRLRALAENYYGARLGKVSPLLRAQHMLALGDINTAARRATGSSSYYYGRAGNVGRARGEQLRIMDAALRSRNRENLGYGQAQEQYKEGNASQYANLLNMLSGLGLSAMPGANNSFNLLSQAGGDWARLYSGASQQQAATMADLFKTLMSK